MENLKVIQIERKEDSGCWLWDRKSNDLVRDGLMVLDPEYDDLPMSIYEWNYGDTFLRNPYDYNEYIKIEDFKEKVQETKLTRIVDILQSLGVKEVCFQTSLVQSYKREIESDNSAKIKLVQINVDVNYKKYIESSSNFSTKYSFPGEQVATEWEYARNLADQYHLMNDEFVKFALDSRRPDRPNKLGSYEKICKLSNETNSSLDVAFKLNVLCGLVKLSSEFKSITETKEILETKFEVQF